MSNDPQQNEFENLRKLLALKRYETPPPGFFNRFSDRVIARIESEEAARQDVWWRRFLNQLDPRPMVATAYAVGFGGLALVGLSFARLLQMDTAEATSPQAPFMAGGARLVAQPQAALGSSNFIPSAEAVALRNNNGNSLQPVMSEMAPSFIFATPTLRNMEPQPASFQYPGH